MRPILLALVASFICAAFIRLTIFEIKKPADFTALEKRSIRSCSPDLLSIDFSDSSNVIPLLNGWGNYRMPVTHNNDSANIYFQQGINMYYGFHIIESLASFEKAVQFDPSFAMGYWGKALAYGPNINDVEYSTAPKGYEAAMKAKELSSNSNALEKALIEALLIRYSPDPTQKREMLDQQYADAMKKIHHDFPKSADAAALYADALMVQHPWDLYDKYYNPKPWTPEIVQVLEKLVQQFPENPGASHYYIHAVEGSKRPQKALKVADRLGSLMPGLAHLVHMPSHIYIRSGYYNKGVSVNADAIKNYHNYYSKFPLTGNGAFIYLVHNQHMQAACAGMDGQYENALKYSYDTRSNVDSGWLDMGGYFGFYGQYMYMAPEFTMIRFGKWDDILKAPAIPENRVYASSIAHLAKGLAFARKKQLNEANDEYKKMLANISHPQLKESPSSFNPGIAAIRVADKILLGVIAEEKALFKEASALFREAVDLEDGMLYNEPKDWLLPARHYLGQSLIKEGKYAEAIKIYKDDLLVNPNNAWALTGLSVAYGKQGNKKESSAYGSAAKKAKARSDQKIIASVF